MNDDDPDGAMAVAAAVAALGDPLRRRLYRFVGDQDHAVSRDEAAAAVRIARSAAAFHLDRLVEEGLLEVEFRRLTGRQGPGAGRPAKLYRRARQEIALSLPARRYEFAAGLLAAAVSESTATGTPVAATLERLAQERGARLAGDVAVPRPGPASAAEWAPAAVAALAAAGYEPRPGGEQIVLANCPFHALVGEHRELVCRMNLAFLRGFSEALPGAGLTARLEPAEGSCCVRLDMGRS